MGRDNGATNQLLCAAAICAALLGCATKVAPSSTSIDCRPGSCDVPVHVDGSCNVTAPDVNVFESNNIFWVIDRESAHAGYKFPDIAQHLGVWIKDDPKGQFDSPERQNDRKFKLHDKNGADGKGSYRYGVRVVKGGTACPDLDPFVVNR